MRIQIKILGIIYLGISFLLALAALFFGIFALFGKNVPEGALLVITLSLTFFFWFFQIGSGLWHLRAGVRLSALIVAVVLMFVLNGALLFADGGKFAASTGQKIFHLSCMTIGLYTAVILLLPAGKAAMNQKS